MPLHSPRQALPTQPSSLSPSWRGLIAMCDDNSPMYILTYIVCMYLGMQQQPNQSLECNTATSRTAGHPSISRGFSLEKKKNRKTATTITTTSSAGSHWKYHPPKRLHEVGFTPQCFDLQPTVCCKCCKYFRIHPSPFWAFF